MENNLFPIKYMDFKNKIIETLKELDSLKIIELEKETKDSIITENENDLFLEFIFLTKYKNHIFINLDNFMNIKMNNNELLSKESDEIKIFNGKNNCYNDIFKILFHMYLLLLNKIEEILSSVFKNFKTAPNRKEIKEIKNSFSIIAQILNLILKLYKENIYNLKNILIFFDVILIFINKVSIISDKYMKLKNMIFLDLLLDKFYPKLLEMILDNENMNKNELSLFIDYLIKILKNKTFESHFNYLILAKNNIPTKIINIFINYINYSGIRELFIKYKDSLLDCFADIYKNKLNQSNFFEILINQNKESFINLMNFQAKKQNIFKDIFMHNFYLELLNKIHSKEKELNKIENEIIPLQSYFLFNGFDSKMIFNLDSFSLNNSIIFFSFRLSPNINYLQSSVFPLIIFETINNTKKILFEILIKRENNINKLYIIQDQKNLKEICLKQINDISVDINYFLAIQIKDKKTNIFISKNGLEKYHEEIEIYDVDIKKNLSIRMKIGNEYNYQDNKGNKVFKGFIGPLIIIKDLKVPKKIEKSDIINSILELKHLYKFFPFFTTKESVYNFDFLFNISSSVMKNKIKLEILNLKGSIESFKCQFYLTPEIINIYYSLYLKNNYIDLPKIPHMDFLKNHNIIEILNISTIIKNYISSDFLRNNGLDYFCLIYEYLYQFFDLIQKKRDELNYFQNNDNIKNNIQNIIKSTLIFLDKYTYYKYILNYQKKFKNLFRNLFDMLKCSNKLTNKIFPGICKNIYETFSNFNKEIIQIEDSLKVNKDNEKLIYAKKVLSPFYEGLIDIILSPCLYEGYKENNPINELFSYLNEVILLNKESNKIFRFKKEYIFNIINFTDIVTKYDNKKENNLVIFYEKLLNLFLDSIKEQNPGKLFYSTLFNYIINNYKNNLVLVKNYFHFINEILSKDYFLENNDIEQILNTFSYVNELNNENNDKKIIEETNLNISRILLKLLFKDNSGEMMLKLSEKLGNIFNNDITDLRMLSNIISALTNFLEELLKSKETEYTIEFLYKKNDKNSEMNYYMNLFEIAFNLIINLFKIIMNKYINDDFIEENNTIKKEDDTLKNSNYFKLVDLLFKLEGILESELTKDKKNIICICCAINFVKFYHHIVFENRSIIQYSDKKITQNILQVFDIMNNFNFVYFYKKLIFKYNDNETKKTLIEIIFEIAFQFFLNDDNNSECYNVLLQKCSCSFFDTKFRDRKKYSIFYIIDILRYNIYKKKTNIEENIKSKCQYLQYYNNIFPKDNEFEGNFSTYFLNIIIEYQNKFEQKKFEKVPILEINNFLDELISQILKEHIELYKIDKKYFFKTFSKNIYNEQITYLKEKYIKNEPSIKEVKKIYKTIFEKYKIGGKENIQAKNSLSKSRRGSVQLNLKLKRSITYVNKNNKNIFCYDFPEDKNNVNKIHYFYDLDKNYIINFKKEIMNCIFSIYYLDEFFYSEDFCKIKKYYISHFLHNKESQDSKKLNFPSIIKNYTNNFDPPLFIKKFNNFIIDPYFSITHSYIDTDKHLIKHISMKKSIKLSKKEYPNLEKTKEIECELIKDEKAFYGKLYYNNSGKYLLFKEEKKDLLKEKGFKYIFLLSYLDEKNQAKSLKKPKISITKNYDKDILILKEDIEEIIEIRILLLWKGIEIYLKNGKSYIFNFLTTKDYENFAKNFISKNINKDLWRKRDFLKDNKDISKDWSKGLITNYEYLLLLNRYGSRSFHDPTQYPVFPWLLADYKYLNIIIKKNNLFLKIIDEHTLYQDYMKEEQITTSEKIEVDKLFYDELKKEEKSIFDENIKEKKSKNENKDKNNDKTNEKNNDKTNDKNNDKNKDKYKINSGKYIVILKKFDKKIKEYLRDFKYPPSFQDEEKRNNIQFKFEQDKQNGVKFPTHSGCHYSTSGYLYFYLMRQQPYDNMLVKMQSYNLENTDRCFMNISSIQQLTKNGSDNRELIPELFSKIELFLNLNCDCYGKLTISQDYLDDCTIDIWSTDKNKETYISQFVTFILDHKKLLNSKIIGYDLKNWIDIIFGEKQLIEDENKRKESCVVFSKYSYEKNINLEKKLEKKIKENLKEDTIINKLHIKITYIINFGVVPTCLFTKAHKGLKREIIHNNDNPNVIKEESHQNQNEIKDNNEKEDKKNNLENKTKIKKHTKHDNDNDEDDYLESFINDEILTKDNDCPINEKSILFKINENLNKIFIYDENDNLLICETEIFNEIHFKLLFFTILPFNKIENSYISNYGDNYLYHINYSFSSFDNEKINVSEEQEEFHTFHYNRINFLLNKEKIKNKLKKKEKEIIKLITCRHLDFSFKIYYIIIGDKKGGITKKIFSYICEDFVSSCCCINSNSFIVGLNNGKLIYFKINFSLNNINIKKNNIEFKEDIKIEEKKYIQAHKGKINVIEIDKRLGLVITAGDDNYIFIRKIYDFELLLPIKIKNKFDILMVKISSFNFMYILCLNKNNKKKIIFGYTLSGIKFAKSEYGLYDNISFNEEGNLITLNEQKNIKFLSGSNLTEIKISDLNYDKKIIEKIKGINPLKWIQYNHFVRLGDDNQNRIFTFFDKEENKNKKDIFYIRTINLSNLEN